MNTTEMETAIDLHGLISFTLLAKQLSSLQQLCYHSNRNAIMSSNSTLSSIMTMQFQVFIWLILPNLVSTHVS